MLRQHPHSAQSIVPNGWMDPVCPTRRSPTLGESVKYAIWVIPTEGIESECVPGLQDLYTACRTPSGYTLSDVNRRLECSAQV